MAGGFGGHLMSQQSMNFGIVGGLQAAGASATSELWDFESESASGSPRASESGVGAARVLLVPFSKDIDQFVDLKIDSSVFPPATPTQGTPRPTKLGSQPTHYQGPCLKI